MLSSLLDGEYATNYPPQRCTHSETKSFAELANDRSYMLPEKPMALPDSSPAGRPSGSRVIGPCSSFFEQRWNLGKCTAPSLLLIITEVVDLQEAVIALQRNGAFTGGQWSS
jgi:hypothetical protein